MGNITAYIILIIAFALGTAASYFANIIKNHLWIGYIGLAVILVVAVQLIIGGLMGLGWITINEPFAAWF